ncbi:MAG: tyrosine-type recombinase/integrase, partial [Mogibacterium sp.]|nr:tyrosine-type recombinase/integrase [Mogibacterium sp.]
MNTVTCTTPDGKVRYYLADEQGVPVPEVLSYLKFLDNQGKARNTLRLSCYQLQNYYRFLEETGKDYRDVTIDDIAMFMAWLRNPDLLKKVVPLRFEPARKEQSINENIDKVISFYDYLVRRGGLENRLSEKLVKFVTHPQRTYKSFLYGIAENRPSRSSILKMPVPQREIRRIKKEEAVALLGECTNIRDYFLLYLLFETGMRIGEALSLWLEDFDLDGLKVSVTDRGELENLAEIKTVHSPRKLDCTQELADLFMGYVCEVHTCDINTNHVFLKLRGRNAGKPMDYTDVDNLFRTLRRKTGIQITPH